MTFHFPHKLIQTMLVEEISKLYGHDVTGIAQGFQLKLTDAGATLKVQMDPKKTK